MREDMKMKTSILAVAICACLIGCITVSCSTAKQAKPGPDAAIQDQIIKAGLALLRVPGDTTENYFKDLKGNRVPPEVRKLEKMLNGDRIQTLQQLVYYADGARALLPDHEKFETRGWVTLTVAAYFNFTPAEVEHVAKLMPRANDFGGMPNELIEQAKANHPTNKSTVP